MTVEHPPHIDNKLVCSSVPGHVSLQLVTTKNLTAPLQVVVLDLGTLHPLVTHAACRDVFVDASLVAFNAFVFLVPFNVSHITVFLSSFSF